MPNAYDDESEFASQQAKELARLSTLERVLVLFSSKNISLLFALVGGLIALATTFISIPPDKDLPSAPFAVFGKVMTDSAVTIARAHNEIREQLRGIPDGDAKRAILDQLDIINREAAGLKAYGDSMQKPKPRSDLGFITSAYAQNGPPPHLTADDVRLYGVVVILMVLGIAFLLCIGIILFSDHARRLTFAIDTVKVLMGFFVGVATSFFGVR